MADELVLVYNIPNESNKTITIPIDSHTYNINWGDELESTTTKTHTYTTSGIKTITIVSSDIVLSYKDLPSDGKEWLTSCTQFDFKLTKINFSGCSGLTTVPNISQLTYESGVDASYMFEDCISFNQDLSVWDTSNLTNMSFMFKGCTSFLGKFNIQMKLNICRNLESMFEGSGVHEVFLSVFYTNITDISDYYSIMKNMFKNCENLTTFTTNVFYKYSLSQYSDITNMFEGAINCKVDLYNCMGHKLIDSDRLTPTNISLHDKLKWTSLNDEYELYKSVRQQEGVDLYTITEKVSKSAVSSQETYGIFYFQIDDTKLLPTENWVTLINKTHPNSVYGTFEISDVEVILGNHTLILVYNIPNESNKTITIPIDSHTYNINWGDELESTTTKTHTYTTSGIKTITIVSSDIVLSYKDLPSDGKEWLTSCTQFDFKLTKINFSGCSGLTTVPNISQLTYESGVDASYMFEDCISFNQDLSVWDTSNLTNMSFMFKGCTSFLGKFNIQMKLNICRSLESMFEGSGVHEVFLIVFYTSAISDFFSNMKNMFKNCENLTTFTTDVFYNYQLSQYSDITNMFEGATNCKVSIEKYIDKLIEPGARTETSLILYDNREWTSPTDEYELYKSVRQQGGNDYTITEKVSTNSAVRNDKSFSFNINNNILTLSDQLVALVNKTNPNSVYHSSISIPSIDNLVLVYNITSPNTEITIPIVAESYQIVWGDGETNNTTTTHTYLTSGVKTITITGNITTLSYNDYSSVNDKKLLTSCTKFYSKLTKINFNGCSNLILVPDIFVLNNEIGVDASYMFGNCTRFNQNLSNWDTSTVTNMSHMFAGCIEFNQPLNFNTSNVTNMSNMFSGCFKFNQPLDYNIQLNTWDTSKVTNMSFMFSQCGFNYPINWDTSKVTDMSFMFAGFNNNGCKFNQPLVIINNGTNLDCSHMFDRNLIFNSTITIKNTLGGITKLTSTSNIADMFFNANNCNIDIDTITYQPVEVERTNNGAVIVTDKHNWTSNVDNYVLCDLSGVQVSSSVSDGNRTFTFTPLEGVIIPNNLFIKNVTHTNAPYSKITYTGTIYPNITMTSAPLTVTKRTTWTTKSPNYNNGYYFAINKLNGIFLSSITKSGKGILTLKLRNLVKGLNSIQLIRLKLFIPSILSKALTSNDVIVGEFDLNVEDDPMVCFKEGTKILTSTGYVPIEKLRQGQLVKTLNNNYLPIVFIGKKLIYHPAKSERIPDQLYKYSRSTFPGLTDDLVLTGKHSILVNSLNGYEKQKTIELLGNDITTDNKYKLPSCIDNRASVYEKQGNHTIYHLALENANPHGSYGIFANGMVVESCSKYIMQFQSDMELFTNKLPLTFS